MVMVEHGDPVDVRLAELAAQTAGIRPADGFVDQIMAAVEQEPAASWFDGIYRSGRRAIVIGALAAAACALLSVHFEQQLDDQVLTAFELVELDE